MAELKKATGAATGRRILRWGIVAVLVCLVMPGPTSGQTRWRGAFVQGGLIGGTRGGALVSGVAAELGLTERLRASARYFNQSRTLCAEDGDCPPEASGFEMGLGYTLGGTSRLVPFTQLLLGYSKERDYYLGGSDTYFSASALLGVDLRIAPPLTFRLAIHHQEIPGASPRWTSSARNTGFFIGLGLTGLGSSSELRKVSR